MDRSRLRGLMLPGLLVLCALAVLVSLGNWQVRRLAWKEDLIARTSSRPKSEPLDLRKTGLGAIGETPAFLAANEYRPVLLRGEYDPEGEVRVFTSLAEPRSGPFGGPGFWIVTPFAAEPDGSRIYVNRGFVPQDRSYEPPAAGLTEIEGLIRAPEQGSWFTPDPDLEKRIFYARDPLRITAATGLAGGAIPVSIDLDASGTPASGLPQAGETMMTFTNNHLQYAITWYGLAAALVAVFVTYVVGRLRQGDKKPA
jgi:surfeit locus 1 family protein